jgi:hypothetical protein
MLTPSKRTVQEEFFDHVALTDLLLGNDLRLVSAALSSPVSPRRSAIRRTAMLSRNLARATQLDDNQI